MSTTISDSVVKNRVNDVRGTLESHIKSLESEGYSVTFGEIGNRTTWALLSKEDGTEITGYTYIRGDLSKKNETTGKYRALLQAMARKSMMEKGGSKDE